jgi:hypothetical protein
MPFCVGERNGGTLAPRKRVDASPRIRDKETETRRAFQPVMDNVINVPTTRYGGMVCAARPWRSRTRRGRLCALAAHEQCMCWHAATVRRLSSLKRVSEEDETRMNVSPAWSFPRPPPPPPAPPPPPDAGAARPKPARLSGSVGLERDQPSPQQSRARSPGGIIIAEADMNKLLPGALRGFRPESPGSSEGSNPPSAEDAAEDAAADAKGSISARTLLSCKSTARGGIDKEVLSHRSIPTTKIIFDHTVPYRCTGVTLVQR